MILKSIFTFLIITMSLQGADILQLVDILDRNDTSALKSHIQTIEDANCMRPDNNKTILMYAVWLGNTDAVTLLVDKGADVNAQDAGGNTALYLATGKEFTHIALHLIKHGASGYTMNKEGETPLDIAIKFGNNKIVKAIKKSTPKLKKLL